VRLLPAAIHALAACGRMESAAVARRGVMVTPRGAPAGFHRIDHRQLWGRGRGASPVPRIWITPGSASVRETQRRLASEQAAATLQQGGGGDYSLQALRSGLPLRPVHFVAGVEIPRPLLQRLPRPVFVVPTTLSLSGKSRE